MTRDSILITGITGQDGYYLAQKAEEAGYRVWGLIRGQNNPKEAMVRRELPFAQILHGDITDAGSVERAVRVSRPSVIANLAAVTFIPASWEAPEVALRTNVGGVVNVLNAALRHDVELVVQASTSEMFGNANKERKACTELSEMKPVSPYGVAKLAAHHLCRNFGEEYGLKTIRAIMFNHESPRRGPEFVTRKIAMAVARIEKGLQSSLELGNLHSARDWGYAPEYMEAILRLVDKKVSGDYVIATGLPATVASFAEEAFKTVGLDWREYVLFDEAFDRGATELHFLCGLADKLNRDTGWQASVTWKELARLMVEAELTC